MIITIASGKGGTGKTTLAVNMAEYLNDDQKNVTLLDCDVEAPNDKLFFKDIEFSEQGITEPKPVWNKDKCKGCGKCREVCRYNAIARLPGKVLIFKELCHSCGACKYICPNNAISEEEYSIGKIYKANLNYDFIYGELNIGETASPSLVKAVKKNINNKTINIIDAPPGTGCSVVSTLEESGVTVLVTEPTPFGLYDLKLAVQLTSKLGIPFGVVINRSDNNDKLIIDFLKKYNIPLLGQIPFERKYAEAYSGGGILINKFADFKKEIQNIYKNILSIADKPPFEEISCIENEKIDTDQTPEEYFNFNQTNPEKPLTNEIMIISGKGGTGKTTVSAAFAQLAENGKNMTVFEDCDVDAADLHLLLKPKIIQKTDFSGGRMAEINPEICNGCGECVCYCRFDAIDFRSDGKFKINELKCEGCGFCLLVCPKSAITDRESVNGQEYISDTKYGPMTHADLGVAEENSGKLVASVRTKAYTLAEKLGKTLIIGDGPPGVGCPVIASITGINLAVIVTEPTVSGIHDMLRVLNLAKHFGIPTKVIINKADLNSEMTEKIKSASISCNSEVIAEIPFDRNVNDALVSGKTIIEYDKGDACKAIKLAWEKISACI